MGDACIVRFGLGCMSARLGGRGRVRTRAIDDEIVIIEPTQFFLEPVYILQEISVGSIGTWPANADADILTHSKQ